MQSDAKANAAWREANRTQRAAGIGNLDLQKPPFSETPAGQPLSTGRPLTDPISTIRTQTNRYYGTSGNVRTDVNTGRVRAHNGIDESNGGRGVKYTGTIEGRVVQADWNPRLGGMVVVEFTTPNGDRWQQKTMHLKEQNVKKGDRVAPGTVIGSGEGGGTIFQERGAGPVHVHTEFLRNGRPVDPSNGQELDFNADRETKRGEDDVRRAEEEAKKHRLP